MARAEKNLRNTRSTYHDVIRITTRQRERLDLTHSPPMLRPSSWTSSSFGARSTGTREWPWSTSDLCDVIGRRRGYLEYRTPYVADFRCSLFR